MPPRGYTVVTLRREAREALERVAGALGRSISDAILELVRRVEECAPELLECRVVEKLEEDACSCR